MLVDAEVRFGQIHWERTAGKVLCLVLSCVQERKDC